MTLNTGRMMTTSMADGHEGGLDIGSGCMAPEIPLNHEMVPSDLCEGNALPAAPKRAEQYICVSGTKHRGTGTFVCTGRSTHHNMASNW